MKSLLIAISMAVAGATVAMAPLDVDAKRLGGGRSAGMQRQAPAQQADTGTPARQAGNTPAQPTSPGAAPTNAAPVAGAAPAAAGAAAAAGKRSWLGPVAGLAAGLGIAALASHFGFGETLANIMTLLLIGLVAAVVIGWLVRRFAANKAGAGNMRLAGAGSGTGMGMGSRSQPDTRSAMQRALDTPTAPVARMGGGSAGPVPAGFDAQEFERIAKMIFIRMQAANDAGNLDDLRKFTTPELFASLRVDLHDRGGKAQQTDVLQLNAQVVDTAQEDGQSIVSVRFNGLIREETDAAAEPFDETWHLVKPLDGSREWAIAGIAQNA